MARKVRIAAIAVLSMAASASAGFVTFNDVCYSSTSGHPALQPHVTTYNIGSGSPGPTSGQLVDKETGESTGVTLYLSQSGGVQWQPDLTSGGDDCAVGTDARSVFDPLATASLKGTVSYGSTGWSVYATFTGLNPAKTYEFVTTANRNEPSYTDRFTRYTISGADAFVNESTPGTIITNGGASTAFNTGDNTATGYVARWTGIRPGADKSFFVRAQADGAQNMAYAFDAIMLAETTIAVNILPDQINTVVGSATVSGAVRIPAGSNADAPVHVTLTSNNPAVADLIGATGGVLTLTFPQGGATEQTIQIDIGQAGNATISSTNDAASVEDDTLPVTVQMGAVDVNPLAVSAPSGSLLPVTVSISAGANDTRAVQVTLTSGNPAVADLIGGTGGVLVLDFAQGGASQQTVDLQLGVVDQTIITTTNNGGLANASLPVTVQTGALTVTPASIAAYANAIRPVMISISAGANDTRSIQVTLTSNDPAVADLIGGTGGVMVVDFPEGGVPQHTVNVQLGAVLDQTTTIDLTNDGGLTNASISVTVAELRSWVVPINELQGGVNGPDPTTSWQMVATGGYDSGGPYSGSYPLDGRYYWRLWDPGLVWQRVYWKFDAPDVPSQPRLYTIECWVPYLGPDDPRSWKQIDVALNGVIGDQLLLDSNGLMIPRNSHNQWIKKGQLEPTEVESGWKPTGPGPNAPDGPECGAGSAGFYMWLKKDCMLYMDGSTLAGLKYGVSALRITEVFSAAPVCDPAASDGPVDLRCIGNADPLYTIGEGFGLGREGTIDGNTLAVEGYRWPCNEGSTQILPLSPGLPYDMEHPEYGTYTAQLPTGDVSFKLRYNGFNTLKWRTDTVGSFSKYNVFTLNEVPDQEFVSGYYGRLYVLATKGGGSSGKLRVEAVYSNGPSVVTEANLYDWFNQDGDAGSLAVGIDGRLRTEGEDVIGFERLNNYGLAPNPSADPPWQFGENGGNHGGAFVFVHPIDLDRTRTLTQVKISLGDVESFGGELVVMALTFEAQPCNVPVFDVAGGEPQGMGPDGAVDQTDFAFFQACFSGNAPIGDPDSCRCFDVNGDQKIDVDDYEKFEACATGPGLGPPPAGCDQP